MVTRNYNVRVGFRAWSVPRGRDLTGNPCRHRQLLTITLRLPRHDAVVDRELVILTPRQMFETQAGQVKQRHYCVPKYELGCRISREDVEAYIDSAKEPYDGVSFGYHLNQRKRR